MAKIAIIGAGFGSLSAASSLIKYGHDVTIYEKYSSPGGRARRITSGDYLTEIGPTVFTMLDVAQKPFNNLDVKLDDVLEMKCVSPSYRGVYSDGTILDWPSEEQDIANSISEFAGVENSIGFENYVKWLEKLVDIEYDKFIARNFNSPLDLISDTSAMVKLLRMGAFRSLDKKVKSFISDPKLLSMCTFQSLYAGVSPSQALAVYCIISYMDLVKGVYYPKGGMASYPEVLAAQLSNAGVKINYNENIKKVISKNNGYLVISDSGEEQYEIVLCNADLPLAFPDIFGIEMPKKISKAKYSPSCMIYVVGGKTNFNDGIHHTIYFSDDDDQSYDELINKKTMMTNPSFLISQPSVTDDSICPKGSQVFYVLEPCPNLNSNLDYETSRELNIARMKSHLDTAGITFDEIDCEIFIDPNDWENEKMYKGTPFSLAHTFFQSGPFRPKNYLKEMPGVFFCGTGTTPGVGIPMTIESGLLAAKRAMDFIEN